MQIIHLSDTHLGRDDNALRLQRLFDDIHANFSPADAVIVHTGDLINGALEPLMQAGLACLDAMQQKGWRILLAPGNHDYGNSLQINPAGAALFQRYFARYLYGNGPAQFPVLNLFDDCALIGLDSNAGEFGWLQRWMAEGDIGPAQREALGRLLDQPELAARKIVLYMHHHPFLDAFAVRADVGDGKYLSHLFGWDTRRFRRLKDAYSLMQIVRDRVAVMLFGHQHYGLDYSREGQCYGVPLALDGSSSTCTQMDTDRMRYRVIDTRQGNYQTRFVALP